MDNRLETFLILCETMNYRLTAERLHLSQPAITKQIQSLEEEFSCRFFYYDGKKLHRTEESYPLETYAYSLRHNYEKLKSRLQQKEEGGNFLRIGLTKTIGDFVLIEDLNRFLSSKENNVELTIDNTENLLELLRENQKDFLILEGNFDRTRYDSYLFSQEYFTGICSSAHPFAQREIPLESLFQETIILREEGSGSRNIFVEHLALLNESIHRFSRTVSISSIHSIKKLVEKNLGITFAYENILEPGDGLSTFSVEGISSYHPFNIVYLPDTEGLALARQFFS